MTCKMGHQPSSFLASTTLAICSKTFLEIYLSILHSLSLITVLVSKWSLLKRKEYGLLQQKSRSMLWDSSNSHRREHCFLRTRPALSSSHQNVQGSSEGPHQGCWTWFSERSVAQTANQSCRNAGSKGAKEVSNFLRIYRKRLNMTSGEKNRLLLMMQQKHALRNVPDPKMSASQRHQVLSVTWMMMTLWTHHHQGYHYQIGCKSHPHCLLSSWME